MAIFSASMSGTTELVNGSGVLLGDLSEPEGTDATLNVWMNEDLSINVKNKSGGGVVRVSIMRFG